MPTQPIEVVDDLYVRVSALGPQGARGPEGIQGEQGEQGHNAYIDNRRLNTPGPPPLPDADHQDDYGAIIIDSDGVAWQWQETEPDSEQGQWVNIGMLVGPVGPLGPAGPAGPLGPGGPQGVSGTEADVLAYTVSLEQGLVVNASGAYYTFRRKQDTDGVPVDPLERLNPKRNFSSWLAQDTTDVGTGITAFNDNRAGATVDGYVLVTDDFIRLDDRSSYFCGLDFSATRVTGSTPVRQSYIVQCYDRDWNLIQTFNHAYKPGTYTTLAAALNPGDTTITLSSAAAADLFEDGTAAPGADRAMLFFDWKSADGRVYTKYTRHISQADLWTGNSINGSVITLRAPWSGAAVAAGTPVANAYPATAALSSTILQPIPALRATDVTGLGWKPYLGVIYPAKSDGSVTNNNLRPGTEFVRVGLAINQGSTTSGEVNTRATAWVLTRTPIRYVTAWEDIQAPNRVPAFVVGDLIAIQGADADTSTIYYYNGTSPAAAPVPAGWTALPNREDVLNTKYTTGQSVQGPVTFYGSVEFVQDVVADTTLAVGTSVTAPIYYTGSTTKWLTATGGHIYLENAQAAKHIYLKTADNAGKVLDAQGFQIPSIQVKTYPPINGIDFARDGTMWLDIS